MAYLSLPKASTLTNAQKSLWSERVEGSSSASICHRSTIRSEVVSSMGNLPRFVSCLVSTLTPPGIPRRYRCLASVGRLSRQRSVADQAIYKLVAAIVPLCISSVGKSRSDCPQRGSSATATTPCVSSIHAQSRQPARCCYKQPMSYASRLSSKIEQRGHMA